MGNLDIPNSGFVGFQSFGWESQGNLAEHCGGFARTLLEPCRDLNLAGTLLEKC